MNKFILFDFSKTLVRMRPPTLLIDKAALVRLSLGNTLGIITGGPRTETINILEKLDIGSLFDPKNVITKNDSSLRKPNPELIFKLVGKNIKGSIYIGDTEKDFKMAKAAGIRFIYVGKAKFADIQLNYNYNLIEEAIGKLLLSRGKK